MEQIQFCQSCGMPLASDEAKGSNADGSKSEDYCAFCYQNGAFTQDMTMDEMIEINIKYIDEWNKDAGTSLTPDEAREQLREFMPRLKRWNTRSS